MLVLDPWSLAGQKMAVMLLVYLCQWLKHDILMTSIKNVAYTSDLQYEDQLVSAVCSENHGGHINAFCQC
jgi:hypothetical protein